MTAAQVRRVVRILLILQVGLFAFFIAGSHDAFVKLPVPTTTDFASFYAAGVLANEGRPEAAYDQAAHRAAEERISAPGIDYKFFFNPPVFLLVCAPLARLPYLVAFIMFEASTFVVWLALTTRIAGGGSLAALTLSAIPSVFWAAGWGQNSFLSAALMALATLLLERRPYLAGLAFGTLCFKPHFGILIPLALLVGRQYRAMTSAALIVSILVGASAAVFGPRTWHAFYDMATHSRGVFDSGRIMFSGRVDPGGAMRVLGLGAKWAWLLQAVATTTAACLMVYVWRRAAPPIRNAALIAATLTAMPFLLFYDLVMAGVAAAWLVRSARQSGFWPGEKLVFGVLIIADLFAYPLARGTPFAVGAVVSPVLLALTVRRARNAAPMSV